MSLDDIENLSEYVKGIASRFKRLSNTDISNLIIEAIETINKPKDFPEEKVYVTEAVGCLRRAYYLRKYGYPTFPVPLSFEAILGQAIHDYIQKAISETVSGAFDVYPEYHVETNILRGRIDILLYGYETAYPVEIKTVSDLPKKPVGRHIAQVNTYLGMLDIDAYIDKGFLVYFSRKKLDVKTFTVHYSKKMYERVIENAKTLLYALESCVPPKAYESDECYFCVYRYRCRADGRVVEKR